MTHYCNTCGVELIKDINWTSSRYNSGNYICKECRRIQEYNRRANAPFEVKLKRKISDALRKHRQMGYEVIGSPKEFMHTYTGECAYCGYEFDIYAGTCTETGTIDRIDNKALTPDNVQWLCHKCNRTKSDRSHKEFMEFIKMMYNKYGEEVE